MKNVCITEYYTDTDGEFAGCNDYVEVLEVGEITAENIMEDLQSRWEIKTGLCVSISDIKEWLTEPDEAEADVALVVSETDYMPCGNLKEKPILKSFYRKRMKGRCCHRDRKSPTCFFSITTIVAVSNDRNINQ